MITRAIILAGGKGERLRPFTDDRPKPMVEINGKPVMYFQIGQMVKAGIKEIVFAVSYQRDFLINRISTDKAAWGIEAKFSVEETLLGRGGGIKQAMTLLSAGWESVLVSNGDILWEADLPGLFAAHLKNKDIATDVVVPLKSPYGVVDFNEADEILAFREKPKLPFWVNSGFYVFSSEIESLLPDVGDHETKTFPKLPKDRFHAFKSLGYWRAVDTIKDLSEAQKDFQKGLLS